MTVYIYGLYEPDTGALRYIGKSIRPHQRLRNHINDKSKCHRTNWIQSLVARGLEPELQIIEEIRVAWLWQDSERYWIAHARKNGARLVNGTNGGEGVEGLSKEALERRSRAWIGRKHRAESLIRIGNASRGRKHSEASKQKMRNLMSGRIITWGAKISQSIRKLNDEQESEIAKRLIAGEMVKDLAAEFSMHRTSISKIKKSALIDRDRQADLFAAVQQ
jgi:GIY-YIG catalytic domain